MIDNLLTHQANPIHHVNQGSDHPSLPTFTIHHSPFTIHHSPLTPDLPPPCHQRAAANEHGCQDEQARIRPILQKEPRA